MWPHCSLSAVQRQTNSEPFPDLILVFYVEGEIAGLPWKACPPKQAYVYSLDIRAATKTTHVLSSKDVNVRWLRGSKNAGRERFAKEFVMICNNALLQKAKARESKVIRRKMIRLAIPTLKWGGRAPKSWQFYAHQNCSKMVYHIRLLNHVLHFRVVTFEEKNLHQSNPRV